MKTPNTDYLRRATAWLWREEHKHQAAKLCGQVNQAFTQHPHETGESYFAHLRFTVAMALRFLLTTLVMLVHGLFPFLLTTAASKQIEAVYRIMRGRVPKTRRDQIDADLDYSV